MAQAESKLSREMAAALRLRGAFVFKIHGGPTMMAGLPDLIICVEGQFAAIETKVPGKRDKVTLIQKTIHGKIHKAGGQVRICCSVKEAVEFYDYIKEGL